LVATRTFATAGGAVGYEGGGHAGADAVIYVDDRESRGATL
jgi:hypothetical protein